MSDLLRHVPEVLRARGWRLYTKKGRLVDLWQYGGRALLGHNPPGLLRAIKNNGERGLFSPLPHFAENRLLKALSDLLPGYFFRLYDNDVFLNQALKTAGFKGQPLLWRPFLLEAAGRCSTLRCKYAASSLQVNQETQPVLFPVLPCPIAPAVLAYNPAETGDLSEKLPPSLLFSPVTLLAAARCIYDLLAVPERGNPRLPKTDQALKKSAVWKRQGIYLFYTSNNYADIFRHFLEGGVLLPPSPEDPAILPGELSPGEDTKLAELVLG